MSDEENVNTSKPSYQLGQDTDDMSVEELEHTICELQEEIKQLENIKAQKSDHLTAANSLFKN